MSSLWLLKQKKKTIARSVWPEHKVTMAKLISYSGKTVAKEKLVPKAKYCEDQIGCFGKIAAKKG